MIGNLKFPVKKDMKEIQTHPGFGCFGVKDLISELKSGLDMTKFQVACGAARMHPHPVQRLCKVCKRVAIADHPGKNLVIFAREYFLVPVFPVNLASGKCGGMLNSMLTFQKSLPDHGRA